MKKLEFFAAVSCFGQTVDTFVPQSSEDWELLDTSTKQNSSFVWGVSLEDCQDNWWSWMDCRELP